MEDFVTYELAVKLKEKGYPQKTAGRYSMIDCFYYDGRLFFHGGACDVNEAYTAPTISQVLKWLRDEKLILIGLSPMQEYDSDGDIEWCAGIYKGDKQGGLKWEEELYYQSYEAAAIAGIEYTIDNLI